jgi:replicative DNA helicase
MERPTTGDSWPGQSGPPAARSYELRAATGLLVALHDRHDRPDGSKGFAWRQADGTLGLGDVRVVDLPLYGIDRLDGLASTVVIVEGEKCAEALWNLGIAAVATITGAATIPSGAVLGELTGLRVFLWPDNDPVGRAHMDRLAVELATIAADVRVVSWPESPDHGDAADYIAAGGNAAGVRTLLEAAEPFVAPATTAVATTSNVDWEAPMSLDRRDRLPAFPTTAMPAWLRMFVEAEAEATQTPLDMAAMFGLAALATVVGGRVEIEPVDGWFEGLNVFVVVAMEPGARKSAVHRDINAPIVEYEQLLVDQAKPDIAEQATIRRIAEAALAKAEKAAASAKDPDERKRAEDQARTCASALERLDVPTPPRLITTDVTPEKLASLLCENGGRMAVLSAEGGIFDIMAGRYSAGLPNLDVYLQGHAGDMIRVDRRGRPSEYVKRPALTVGLAVQPYVLTKAARVADFGGRGLLDRFLYAVPAGTVGYRRSDAAPVPAVIRREYDTTLRALAASFDRISDRVVLRLSPEAAAQFRAWRTQLEVRRRPEADLGHIPGWSSKLDGAVARIAGLFHVAGTITTGWDTPVSAETMSAAIEVGAYLTDHALAAFGLMGSDPRLEAARRISRWIIAGGHRSFTKRDAFRALRGQALFPTSERVGDGLAALEDLAWVRQLPAERGPGRPSARYEANPGIFSETWTKRPELAAEPEPDEVVSILSMDPASSPDEPELPIVGGHDTAAPTADGLWDWPARPYPDGDERATDGWGTIG